MIFGAIMISNKIRSKIKNSAKQNNGTAGTQSPVQYKFEPGMDVLAGTSRNRGTLIKEERKGD